MYFNSLSEKDNDIIEKFLPKFTIQDLMDHGFHYGHKASKWNPSMRPYILGVRNGVHIIDLKKTHYMMTVALLNLYKEIKDGKSVLFVCTNQATRAVVKEFAVKCGQPYVTHRWLGGMLTNWRTIVVSIKKIKKFEKILSERDEKGRHQVYAKKEINKMSKELDKLRVYFDGLRNVNSRPDNIIVFDAKKDDIAIKEAVKLRISPTVVCDTNCSTREISYVIPSNNDSRKVVKFMSSLMCDTILSAIQEDVKSYKMNIKGDHSDAAKKSESLNSKIKAGLGIDVPKVETAEVSAS